jgi:hypothetical protein
MSTTDEPYRGEGRTFEAAADDAARQIPETVQNETIQVTAIYARLSGEHNPIHGWIVDLGP